MNFVFALGLISAIAGLAAAERFDWMPEESVGGKLRPEDTGGERIIPETVLTRTPKSTADLSKFTRVYTIDLKKFDVSNDGTHPVDIATGINQGLQGGGVAAYKTFCAFLLVDRLCLGIIF